VPYPREGEVANATVPMAALFIWTAAQTEMMVCVMSVVFVRALFRLGRIRGKRNGSEVDSPTLQAADGESVCEADPCRML
jgi:hypothetical protein